MKNIFVLGSINTDLVIQAPYFPSKGETLTGSGFFTAQGGKGANQAVAASRLGGKVYMCGKVGNDKFGKASLEALKKENIDITNIKIANCSSGLAIIIIAEKDNTIILERGANYKINREDVDAFLSLASKGDIFLTQLEIPLDIVDYALLKAKEIEMTTILNPAPMDIKIKKSLKYVDLILPNETELAQFGGEGELLKYAGTIIETCGGSGYKIITSKEKTTYPCLKVNVLDTTSAGDTLCGGLAAHFASGFSLEESAKFGSFAASIACTKLGAQPSIPTVEEVKKYL